MRGLALVVTVEERAENASEDVIIPIEGGDVFDETKSKYGKEINFEENIHKSDDVVFDESVESGRVAIDDEVGVIK